MTEPIAPASLRFQLVVIQRMKIYRPCRCVCDEPGFSNSRFPGILAGLPNKSGHRLIERCDTCERFSCDEAACEAYSKFMGGRAGYDGNGKVVFSPL